jgi:hypothetical protein
MHLKYEHWFGNESNKSLLEAYGLVDHGIQIDQLRSKQCPQCNEPNKPDARFCANTKCRMVLSYDAWEETLQQQDQQKLNMDRLEEGLKEIAELKRNLGLQ